MTLRVRRVITGHDEQGRALVLIDETSSNVISRRPGHSSCVVWTTETVPADNSGDRDAGAQPVGTSLQGGTVFRLIEFAPGVAPRLHRTQSVDYGVIVSGEIDMELDGSVVHLAAGDVFVQRGTVHNWVNRSERPCIMAVVLVSAQAVRVGDHSLNAIG